MRILFGTARRNAWIAPLTIATAMGLLAAGPTSSQARTISAASWSSAVAISTTNQPDSRGGSQLNAVAVNKSGLTIAAWDQSTYDAGGGATIGAAVQSGGRWGAPFTISGTSGYSMTPSVAVGDEGTMAVSWTYQDPVATTASPQQKVQVAIRPASAAAWTTYTLDQGPIGGVAVITFVPVGIDQYGNVTAAWTMWNGTRHVVKAATLLAGEKAWGSTTELSGSDDGLYLGLSVNAAGKAAIVYSLSPYTSLVSGTSAQFVSRDDPYGAKWSAPTPVSETVLSSVGYIVNPQVALDARGLATVVYMGFGIEAVRQLADGSWTSPATVISAAYAGSSYMSPDLAVDGAGNAIVAASIFDATIGVDRASVWVTRGTPDGRWTTQERITDPTVPIDAYATRVAVSPDGSLAMVGWIDHYHGTVQVSKWTGTAWGMAETIGRGTAFASFQEVLGLDIGAGAVARATWKSTAKGGTRTMAASYR